MAGAVEEELAAVLVCQEEGLGKTAADGVDLGDLEVQVSGEGRICDQVLGLSLCPLVLGDSLGVFEDFGFKEIIVGVGGFVEEARTLSMQLQGILETLQGFVNLAASQFLGSGMRIGVGAYMKLAGGIDLIVTVLLELNVDGLEGRLRDD